MKPTHYWLTRDKDSAVLGEYALWKVGAKLNCNRGDWQSDNNLIYLISTFCGSLWYKFTGIRLRKGTKVKVKVTKLKNGFKMQIAK